MLDNYEKKVVLNIGSFLCLSKTLEIKLSFSDLIAKLCAVSGLILKIKDLNFENIILFYL